MDANKPIPRKYEPVTKAAPAERQKLEKIVSGTAKVKKKSEIRKFTDVFVAEDANSVKSYIVTDVIIPAAKKLIYDIFTDGIDMILYGGRGGDGKRSIADRVSYRQYDKYYDRKERRVPIEPRNAIGYGDVTVPTKGDAEAVLSQMDDLIESYGVVYVADLYELVGLPTRNTDFKYGWTSLRNADSVRLRGGEYMLRLPRAMPMD